MMNVLFDLVGTLTDPREGIVACLKHALLRLGRTSPADSELARFIGPPLQEIFGTLLGSTDSKDIDSAVTQYRQRFSSTGMFENKCLSRHPFGIDHTSRERRGAFRRYFKA